MVVLVVLEVDNKAFTFLCSKKLLSIAIIS